jgi:hypothetical protein
MPADSCGDRYRVIAIRSDGTEVVLATRLRIDHARAIVEALADVSAFSRLEIQPDAVDPPAKSP